METLQTTEILLLKALREEDFGHELQQMSSLFSSDLDKVKLGTQLKTLVHIIDEKQVKIKMPYNYFFVKCISNAVSI